jgi:hypothetical protein
VVSAMKQIGKRRLAQSAVARRRRLAAGAPSSHTRS